MKKMFFLVALLATIQLAQAAKMSPQAYIKKYKKLAILEMNRTGIPASITLAQGILESGSGNSLLARKNNNHFGIKHGTTYKKYPSVFDCFMDHSRILTSKKNYENLFSLAPTDYKGWAYGLRKAGYASNPKYGALLVKVIQTHDLDIYDRMFFLYREPFWLPDTKNPFQMKGIFIY